MYTPTLFRQNDKENLFGLIRANPLGTIILATDSGLVINHIPFLLDTVNGEAKRLRAHIPRANPLSSLTPDTPHHCA
jgi:transcriptional regulator